MITTLKRKVDQWLGRGDAAITVPPMDGPFKPNRLIEDAELVYRFDDPEDMAWDGEALWVAAGRRLLRSEVNGQWSEYTAFQSRITALAFVKGCGIVVAVEGDGVVCAKGDLWKRGVRSVAGRPLSSINSLSSTADGGLLATEGSRLYTAGDWSRDLMSLGNTGRLVKLTADAGNDVELANGMRYAWGAIERNGKVWTSESWAHRIEAVDSRMRDMTVINRLPAYPSRMSSAAKGGVWVTFFAARTRLVEFVLREDEYRRRMVAEVDPRYWVAPAMSSGNSYLEPLQGGSVKMLGILKPWAPPRSYGLVARLDAQGLPQYTLHSRADGKHHGIVAAHEANGYLYLLSKGSGSLLRLRLDALSAEASA